MTYLERDGIWHIVHGDTTRCGLPAEGATELDFTPKPMCWRCRDEIS